HGGKGLGHDFLKHIERTRLLFHVVDIYGFDNHDAATCVRLINEEMRLFSPELLKKPMVLVVNKMDLAPEERLLKAFQKRFKKFRIFPISAVSGQGVSALLAWAGKQLAKTEELAPAPVPEEPLRFVVERDYEVDRDDQGFVVKGSKVERLAAMTHFEQPEGL